RRPAIARPGIGDRWASQRRGRALLSSLHLELLQPGQPCVVSVEQGLMAMPRSPEPRLVLQAEEPATAQHQADQRPVTEELEEPERQFGQAVGGGQERRKDGTGRLPSQGQVGGSHSRLFRPAWPTSPAGGTCENCACGSAGWCVADGRARGTRWGKPCEEEPG